MDFAKLSPQTCLGQLLRLPLRLVPVNAQLPILSGPLRGQRWLVAAGRNGCWLGTYERENQRHLARLIQPGDVVFDVGAHAGFFTLLAAAAVGSDRGQVVAFEPLPRNLAYLREHLRLNGIQNVTVQAIALSEQAGTAPFIDNATGYQGGLSERGQIQVQTETLDRLIAAGTVPIPNVLKMDVEGHEKFVLLGAQQLFQAHHPKLFLSVHGRTVLAQCRDLLTAWGYELEILDRAVASDLGSAIADQLPKNLDLIARYRG